MRACGAQLEGFRILWGMYNILAVVCALIGLGGGVHSAHGTGVCTSILVVGCEFCGERSCCRVRIYVSSNCSK